VPINWRFFLPKFVDIEPGLLELFENVIGVRFFLRHSVLLSLMLLVILTNVAVADIACTDNVTVVDAAGITGIHKCNCHDTACIIYRCCCCWQLWYLYACITDNVTVTDTARVIDKCLLPRCSNSVISSSLQNRQNTNEEDFTERKIKHKSITL